MVQGSSSYISSAFSMSPIGFLGGGGGAGGGICYGIFLSHEVPML